MLGLAPLCSATDVPVVGHVLYRDYETRSRISLKLVGAHRYAADSTTEILCAAYAVDNDPVRLWLPGDPIPSEFTEAASNTSWSTCAHGDHFESAIEQHVLAPRHGWPSVPLERHRCTMAMSLAAGLPARLDKVADALELTNRKDTAGERLMHQMSKPRHAHKDEDPDQVYWFDDHDRLGRLYDYCRQDVEVEREIHDRLPALSSVEQAGRWVGEGFQPQNLKRPMVEDLNAVISAVATGDYDHVRELYPRPLSVVGDCSRSMIVAAPGHVLIGADLSSIEFRVLDSILKNVKQDDSNYKQDDSSY
jgi:hypothetical protein